MHDAMQDIRALWIRLTRKLAPTPKQAEQLATIKFPCC